MSGNATNATLPPEVAQFVTDGKALIVSGSTVGGLLLVLVCGLLYCCRRMRKATTDEAKERRMVERKKRFEEATLRREEERRKLEEKRTKSAGKQRRGVNASYDARLDQQNMVAINVEDDDGRLKKPSLLSENDSLSDDDDGSPTARRASVVVHDRATVLSNSSFPGMQSPLRSASKRISPEQPSVTAFGQSPEENAVVAEAGSPPSPPRQRLFVPHLSVSRPVAIPRTAAEEAMQRTRHTMFEVALAQHQREARALEERRAREAEARLEEQRREAEKHRLDAKMLISGLRKESIGSIDRHIGTTAVSPAVTSGTKRMQVVHTQI